MEYTSPDEVAVCNLASVALPKFIDKNERGFLEFNHEKLREVTKQITKNLNKIIDVNYYPTAETKFSNFKNRPIGIGIQGLQDVFILLGLEFTSEKSRKLNILISAYMYYASVEKSHEIALVKGKKEYDKRETIKKRDLDREARYE